jgi:hypothetical protein
MWKVLDLNLLQDAVRSRFRFRVGVHVLGPFWKLVLATVAILDVLKCWSVVVDGWTEGRKETKIGIDLFVFHKNHSHGHALSPGHPHSHNKDMDENDTCPIDATSTSTIDVIYSSACYSYSDMAHPLWKSIGIVFFLCCILESVLRAREARQIALETAALDKFEKKLADLYQATRCNVFRKQPSQDDYPKYNSNDDDDDDNYNNDHDMVLARTTLRVWTPVASIFFGWFILLPWTSLYSSSSSSGYQLECGDDPSLATLWITQSIAQMHQLVELLQSQAMHYFWKLALPFSFMLKPIQLIQRIRLLSRWVRYVRFAGPLLRLLLKVQDQFWVFTKTWRQSWQHQAERAKRLAHRSMLFEDIQRIESLTRVQTALATWPSSIFHMAQEQATDIGAIIAKKKKEGQRLQRRLDSLKSDLRRSARLVPSSEIYDRMVALTQELTDTVKTAFWNAQLISPHTRFSVGWRLVVTCALLSELVRLYTSWKLSGTFEIRYTDMTRQLLVECEQKSKPIRSWIGKHIFRHNAADQLLDTLDTTCSPASPSARLALHLARASEISIDLVCFFDIFVWFFTGELDEHGVIRPKHWFSRCVLPGTLVQVLDHPTVPEKLPQLLSYSWKAVRAVGYSRVIRWGLAIYPAVDMMLVAPLKSYLFRPMDVDEYLKYTESIALMQGSFSSASINRHHPSPHPRSASLASLPSGMLHRSHPSETFHSSMRSDIGNNSENHQHGRGSLEDSINFGYGLYY